MTAKELVTGVYYIPGPTNVGVITSKGRGFSKAVDVYLVDSGGDREDAERIYGELEELFPSKKGGFKLRAVINTHSHADHAGGNAFFAEKTGCQIWCPRVEAGGLECSLLQSIIHCGAMPLEHMRSSYYVAEPSKADLLLDEKAQIKLRGGSSLSFISLPGHYLGMLGVLFTSRDGKRVFFPGDAVFGRNHVLKFWISYLVDLDSFKETLLKLDQTDFTWYVPSHGEPAEEIHETVEMNQIAILSTERSILKALEGGMQLTFSELMKKVADMNEIKMRTPQYLLIGGTIRSYLCSLYGRNKITCGMKDNMLLWSLAEEN